MTTPSYRFALSHIAILIISLGACGGGSSSSITGTSQPPNPSPTVTAISPIGSTTNAADFTLTVDGYNFVSSSVVQWNGSPRKTKFVNSTQVAAAISNSDVKSAGTVAVTVFNPAPGGGSSKSLTFAVEPDTASIWQTVEFAFNTEASYSNPFTDNTVTCEFDGPSGQRTVVSAFYDGNGIWRVRFTPTALGAWSYRTTSSNVSDLGLHSISGQLNVTAASDNTLYVGSKLKCPVSVAREMSGFKVVPSPMGSG